MINVLIALAWPNHLHHRDAQAWFSRKGAIVGVSCENQKAADERIPLLLQTPAAVRFVSLEPLLGPIVLPPQALWAAENMWVVVGGESGPGARPMPPEWPRGLRDQCAEAGVPFFFRSWGEWAPTRGAKKTEYIDAPVGDGTHHRMFRVGKRAAGHLLDGKAWRQMPEACGGAR